MSKLKLIRQFQVWADTRQPLVLATVVSTRGHTYSKPGEQMVICGGNYQGMVSGGCLEGDIAEHAARVLASGESRVLNYDLRSTVENELIGLGVGCEGEIRLLLQRLTAEEAYEPFASMAKSCLGTQKLRYRLALTGASDVALGDSLLVDINDQNVWGNSALAQPSVGPSLELFDAVVQPLPRLLIAGAGIDAQPLAALASDVGWLVTVTDNRPQLLEAMGQFDIEQQVRCLATELAANIDLTLFDAAVIMSHHLEKDRCYLGTLVNTQIPYLGVLGPVSRTRRLLDEIDRVPDTTLDRLHSPIGLDIGANSPETIALSIMGEIQAVLYQRDGRFLKQL